MNHLNEKQVDFLEQEIGQRGISIDFLRDEILDHFCCAVEKEMAEGLEFEDAYRKAYLEICPDGLQEIEWETKLVYINKNHSVMKKLVFILGYVGAFFFIIGYTFKMMHWPTANIQIMLGGVLFGLGFVPAYFVLKYRTEKALGTAKSAIVYVLNGSLATFLVMISPYKFLKWPGHQYIFLAGLLVLALVFLPRVFMAWYKKSAEGNIRMQ